MCYALVSLAILWYLTVVSGGGHLIGHAIMHGHAHGLAAAAAATRTAMHSGMWVWAGRSMSAGNLVDISRVQEVGL